MSMGIFATNPVAINDGTNDRDFSFRAQRTNDPKSVVGDWIEDAASTEASSLITIKHDQRSRVPRDLVQRTIKKIPASTPDSAPLPITLNFTVVAAKAFTDAEILPEVNLLVDAITQADFIKGLRTGKI